MIDDHELEYNYGQEGGLSRMAVWNPHGSNQRGNLKPGTKKPQDPPRAHIGAHTIHPKKWTQNQSQKGGRWSGSDRRVPNISEITAIGAWGSLYLWQHKWEFWILEVGILEGGGHSSFWRVVATAEDWAQLTTPTSITGHCSPVRIRHHSRLSQSIFVHLITL